MKTKDELVIRLKEQRGDKASTQATVINIVLSQLVCGKQVSQILSWLGELSDDLAHGGIDNTDDLYQSVETVKAFINDFATRESIFARVNHLQIQSPIIDDVVNEVKQGKQLDEIIGNLKKQRDEVMTEYVQAQTSEQEKSLRVLEQVLTIVSQENERRHQRQKITSSH